MITIKKQSYTKQQQLDDLIEFLSSYLNNNIRKHGIPPKDYSLLVRKNLNLFGLNNSHKSSRQYTDRVIQHFSPKKKIDLEIIKDLHTFVGKSLGEFSNNNSRLSNKLVSYRAERKRKRIVGGHSTQESNNNILKFPSAENISFFSDIIEEK
ncbi:unnamed protein product [Rotaria sordida]|uniref:Uncharacterized protein n=1 Tax=Rotaria sordida TaxID=392033 RepID=A0A815ES84_9BILA|nr:unnamed protein product [Rotaria sordida]CAF1315407.1 unnamed protein product [Rotaria sordida]CAF1582716.1 unnamed protein product [Rotaria sordida]CAF1582741.1 unnamed protein product [Rotaria sordida]